MSQCSSGGNKNPPALAVESVKEINTDTLNSKEKEIINLSPTLSPTYAIIGG